MALRLALGLSLGCRLGFRLGLKLEGRVGVRALRGLALRMNRSTRIDIRKS